MSRRVLTRLALVLAALGVLAVALISVDRLTGARAPVPAPAPVAPEATAPLSPDNPRPPRNLTKMNPDQFDVVVNRDDLRGSPVAHILVLPDKVELLVGDRILWTGFFRPSATAGPGPTTLAQVAELVARSPAPEWLRETKPGVFLLQVGLTQAPTTVMEFAAPRVRELRLASNPYVYITGVGATAMFRGVTVTSWQPGSGRPDTDATHRRPFISYDEGGRLDVIDSEFAYLGSDSSKAYGVTWGEATGGQAVGSVFHHNLFGAYTSRAVGVVFQNNVFRDNAIYGLDPHTSSYGLVVTDNEAYGNNSHGIIFSENVTNSVVSGNRSHHNGENGIMMDENSGLNIIKNNEVWSNGGDGIVIQGSSNVLVTANTVTANGVGIRVNANDLGATVGTQVSDNQLSDNRRGVEVYGGARDTVLRNNVIRNSLDQGIVFAEPASSQNDTVIGAQKAVVVDRVEATLRGLAAQDVDRGVVVTAGGRAIVEGARIVARDTAVDMDGPAALELTGTSAGEPSILTGARKGVVVQGTATVRNVTISEVERGIIVTEDARATIENSAITARSKGVDVLGSGGAGRVTLRSSDIRAPEPLVGADVSEAASNDLIAVPSWLAVAGAVFVGLALVLHLGHRLWSPRSAVRHKAVPQFSGGGHDS